MATVNNQPILRQDFERELARELNFGEVTGTGSGAGMPVIKESLLESIVERALLLRAARDANIVAAPEDVDRELLWLRADYPSDGLDEALAQGRMTMAELKEKTAALLTIQKLFQDQVYARVGVTEEEIRVYYEEHPAEFDQSEQVRAAQIVVKTAPEAGRIQQQLRAGQDFAELARKYSLSPDAKVGGDLGFFSRGQMPRPFDEVAFKLKLNQVSEVVSTDYGFHLFKVLAKRPARKRPLSEARGPIEQKLLGAKREKAQAEYVKMLKSKAVIKVNESILAAAAAKARAAQSRPDRP